MIKSFNQELKGKGDKMKMDDKYLHNDYFYLSCNCCDRLILVSEMTKKEYDQNAGCCFVCAGRG